MKLYVSEDESIFKEFELVNKVDDADNVVVMPGGLSSLKDMFEAIIREKTVYLYNKNQYYNEVINQLYNMHKIGAEKRAPFEYIQIESDINVIMSDLKEKNDHSAKHM